MNAFMTSQLYSDSTVPMMPHPLTLAIAERCNSFLPMKGGQSVVDFLSKQYTFVNPHYGITVPLYAVIERYIPTVIAPLSYITIPTGILLDQALLDYLPRGIDANPFYPQELHHTVYNNTLSPVRIESMQHIGNLIIQPR